jgi:S-DNA-T family DNA segregation ATPase FtsK/SpoIIIE
MRNRYAPPGLVESRMRRETHVRFGKRPGETHQWKHWQGAPDRLHAELPDEAKELADSIARRGRAVCVTLLVATQRPTQAAMGTATAIRSQMDIRICLRVRERRDVDLILGQGALHAGWVAHTLDVPGKFLISSPEHQIPRPARGYLVIDEEVTRRAATNTPLRPPLPPKPATDDNSPNWRGDIATAPAERDHGPDAARNPVVQLWDALVDTDEDGATAAELMDATGKGRTWVYDRLQEHLDAGRVIQPARGRWRATPHHADPGSTGPS